jgi:hypothetical protein|tara:strand:- start:13147 stop:13707 length:561 start_codon:yes stop_codon:yes gene_type:complete
MSKEKPLPKISKKNVRKDLTGTKYGPWVVQQYVHHYNTSPIWEVECEYCGILWEASIPRIKKKRECDCEESLKWTSGVFIPNNIFKWYSTEAKRTDESWRLTLVDLYKLYNRQNGVDSNNNKLIFKYHIDYNNTPATVDYIWPDLRRKSAANSFTINNCYLEMNYDQRFPRKRGNLIKKLEKINNK